MAYIRIKGVTGKIYVPDETGPKKHNCTDCFYCQMCSNERCASCLKQKSKKHQKHCCKKKEKAKKV